MRETGANGELRFKALYVQCAAILSAMTGGRGIRSPPTIP